MSCGCGGDCCQDEKTSFSGVNNMRSLARYGFGRSVDEPTQLPPRCPSGFDMDSNGDCIPSRLPPIEVVPVPVPIDTSANGAYSIYGMKPPKTLNTGRCNGIVAPNGYHVIETAQGCVMAVNYDSNIVNANPSTVTNPLGNLISALTGNSASASGTDSGVSGLLQNKGLLLAAAVAAGFYFMSKNKRTPKTYDRTESYKY